MIVDFRNGGDAEAPAGTMDMLAAIRWVVANAESIGVDPGRVSVTNPKNEPYPYPQSLPYPYPYP